MRLDILFLLHQNIYPDLTNSINAYNMHPYLMSRQLDGLKLLTHGYRFTRLVLLNKPIYYFVNGSNRTYTAIEFNEL